MPEPRRTPELVLPAGAEWDGLVCLRRAARIDGRVRGEVAAAGSVWIGESGEVDGRLDAEEVVVAGQLRGEVRARGRVELLAGALVRAELSASRLVLADGSFFEGNCTTGGEASDAGGGFPAESGEAT